MLPRKHNFRLAIALAVLAATSLPARAALFGDDEKPAPAQPVAVTEETVINIQRAIDEQRLLDAGTMLEQALLQSGNDPKLLLLAGRLSLARGHSEEALASFKAIESSPGLRAEALEGEGISLSELGRSRDAMKILQEAVTENPQSWRAWNALGAEYDRLHDFNQAEAAYDHAVSDSDGAPIVLNNRGFSFMLQGKLPEAVADFVAALGKKPDFTAARNNLRLAVALKGEYDRAVNGAGDKAAALNNAGFAAMLRGDYARAKDLLGQAVNAKGAYYGRAAANLESAKSLEAENTSGSRSADVAH